MLVDINEVILHIKVNGAQRQLISAYFICDYMNIHRRLIQNLVQKNQIKMYNGLLDFIDVLKFFPNLCKFNIVFIEINNI